MTTQIDIEKAVSLINDKKTSTDDMCRFIYEDILQYQNSRENFYMDEFKEEFGLANISDKKNFAKAETEKMILKIKKDVQKYSIEFAIHSTDMILDAMNEKRFKTKKRLKTFLVLLCTLKEVSEELP